MSKKIGVALIVHGFDASSRLLVERLMRDYDSIVIHVDTSVDPQVLESYQAFASPNVLVINTRHVEWGRWGIVAATLDAVAALLERAPDLDYVAVISGSCYPIQSARASRDYLTDHPFDYIEAFDIFSHRWVMDGPQAERLYWWYPFDFWKHRRLFDVAYAIQNKLKIRRPRPPGYAYAIGSQWCLLRAETWRSVIDRLTNDQPLVRFMQNVWIPDETAIQTVVRTIVPEQEIVLTSPTLYHYNCYGRPVQFFAEHAELLTQQGFFFARKLATSDVALRKELDRLTENAPLPKDFQLGKRTGALSRMGRPTERKRQFPKLNNPFRTGQAPSRGRAYHVVFCSKEVAAAECEQWCRRNLKGASYVGPLFAYSELNAPQWFYQMLDLTPNDFKVRDAFPHDFLTLIVDHAPSEPVLVIPQDTKADLVDRIVADTNAHKIILFRETKIEDGYLPWIAGKLSRGQGGYELHQLQALDVTALKPDNDLLPIAQNDRGSLRLNPL